MSLSCCKESAATFNPTCFITTMERTLEKDAPVTASKATFITFKPIYDASGQEIKMEVCDEIRVNMLALAN